MDQRTRERLPVLPALVASADAQRRASRERLEAAAAAGPGELFTAGGQTLRRSVLAIGLQEREDLGRRPRHRAAP